MPHFETDNGKRYRIVVEGYVYGNGGGWLSLCSEVPVMTPARNGGFDTYHLGPVGEKWQVPEHAVANDPERLPDYPEGTLFEYGAPTANRVILRYEPAEDLPWAVVGSGRRRDDDKINRRYLRRLFREGEV